MLDYSQLHDDIIKYVINNKKNGVTVLELLCEYAFKNDLEYELVGDAVMEDECIKNVIANEVKLNNRVAKVDEWWFVDTPLQQSINIV